MYKENGFKLYKLTATCNYNLQKGTIAIIKNSLNKNIKIVDDLIYNNK